MTQVLGISAYYHDSAAALIRDGEILAAAEEERFTRKKHDARFPVSAINYCLGEAFVEPTELDAVVFYDSPLLTFDRVVKNAVTSAPGGCDQFVSACRTLLGAKGSIEHDLEACLGEVPRLLVTPHHMAHAASCFYPSPFERAAILTIDGVGEWATCTLGAGVGTRIELLEELQYPHSLGLLYSAFTSYCGFKVNSGEYKLMGLAPYGVPRFATLIRDELIDVRDDGSFRLNTSALGYLDSPFMTNSRFDDLFGGPPRQPGTTITRREMDLAASVQVVAEEIVLRLVAHVMALTGQRALTMAGGVALNCVANGRVLRESGVDGLFVQPAAGDAGGALGAALIASGTSCSACRDASTAVATRCKVRTWVPSSPPTRSRTSSIAKRSRTSSSTNPTSGRGSSLRRSPMETWSASSADGWSSGRARWARESILGDPRRPDMQARMNLRIKFRESFRPFAPSVLAEHAGEWFELDGESPYMLVTAPLRAHHRCAVEPLPDAGDDMLPLLNQVRSDIPAVTHVDWSARVQTVGADANPNYRRLLQAFHVLTGCPVLVNTSFNVRGEPIVCTPQDAYRCFMHTGIDLLVLGDRLVWKHEQPVLIDDDGWTDQHEPD